jgi:Ca2+-binding RTX toxin-like protein
MVTMVNGKPNWPANYLGSTNNGNDEVIGTEEDNEILGGNGRDKLLGNGGADDLKGGADSDTIQGGDGADEIWGDGSGDILTGGADSDIFYYIALLDSSRGNPDTIEDFNPAEDTLHLAGVDADYTQTGDQSFVLATSFTKVPGQLVISTGKVEGDVDGNGTADLVINFATGTPDAGAIEW